MNVYEQGAKKVYPFHFEINYGALKTINCYIFDDGQTITLIDAGIDLPAFHQYFEQQLSHYGLTYEQIDQILLTHHHEDHVGIVNKILQHKTVPVYAHYQAIERLEFDPTYLSNKLRFFEKLYDDYGCLAKATNRLQQLQQTINSSHERKINTHIRPLYEGDVISGLKVMEVPGHSPDSILFYDEQTSWCFAGDLAFKNGSSNALIDFDDTLQLLPTVMQQKQSLLKTKELNISVMFSGHQYPFTDIEDVLNVFLNRINRKSARIEQVLVEKQLDAYTLAELIYGVKAEQQFSLVMSEIIGYLYFLELEGRVQKTWNDHYWEFSIQS